MRRTLVLDVVGLTPAMIGDATPNLSRLAASGGVRPLRTILPAVTCSVQSTLLTGLLPRDHGCVGNGWYVRDLAEVMFWRQANGLVAGEKVWEAGRRRDGAFTCAKLFWWYNMYATADITVTPRPMYPADGRKIPDIYTQPADLRPEPVRRLGQFPLFRFWGPMADLLPSQWIAGCARHVFATYLPTLTLVYLPHLDYNLQRLGPDDARIAGDLGAIDGLCGELIEMAERAGAAVLVLSEYGITPVAGAVLPNRALRAAGLLRVREEMGRDLLDAGASAALRLSGISCGGRSHNAKVKRSSKRMASWALAIAHSRGGIFHSFAARFNTRNRSFRAASSVGKCPLERTARRNLAFRLSIAFVV